jgi:hypothetical protein
VLVVLDLGVIVVAVVALAVRPLRAAELARVREPPREQLLERRPREPVVEVGSRRGSLARCVSFVYAMA